MSRIAGLVELRPSLSQPCFKILLIRLWGSWIDLVLIAWCHHQPRIDVIKIQHVIIFHVTCSNHLYLCHSRQQHSAHNPPKGHHDPPKGHLRWVCEVHFVRYLGLLYTWSQGWKNLGPILSIFRLGCLAPSY
jgi:hypothetical protein